MLGITLSIQEMLSLFFFFKENNGLLKRCLLNLA